MHMDIMVDHPEHHEDEHHVDADVDFFKLVFAKLVKIDTPLLLTLALLLMALCAHRSVFFYPDIRYFPHRIIGLRPPLRAPPILPA